MNEDYMLERYEESRRIHPSNARPHVVTTACGLIYGPFVCEADAWEWAALWGDDAVRIAPLSPPLVRVDL